MKSTAAILSILVAVFMHAPASAEDAPRGPATTGGEVPGAQMATIQSTEFDFVQRVSYGASRAFMADAANFSTYAVGDDNSAQQTWLRVTGAVTEAAGRRTIRVATLVFQAGTGEAAARTVYLARTSLGVTADVDRKTMDGSTAYPAVPGTSKSFSTWGYLSEPLAINLDATGAGEVDVTDWVKNHPGDVWFLTASPAARGEDVDSVRNANWDCRWHWPNRMTGAGSPVQLVLVLSPPDDAPPVVTRQPPARAAQYIGESLTLSVEADAGGAALSYQWRRNGREIPGAVDATLALRSVAPEDAGLYQVVVSNRHDSATSTECDLIVVPAPDVAGIAPPAGQNTRYHARGNAVIGSNQRRFFNRPLYINNTDAFILTGDRPMVKFASGKTVHGHFLVGVQRGVTTRWLHDFADITAMFQPARTTWLADDPALPGLRIRVEALALGGITGFAARVSAAGAREGDRLVWAFGGAVQPVIAEGTGGDRLNRSLDPYNVGNERLLAESFDPARARGNQARVHDGAMAGSFSLAPPGGGEEVFGRVTAGTLAVAGATAWESLASLAAAPPGDHPIIVGSIPLSNTTPAHWSFTRTDRTPAALADDTDPATLVNRGLSRSADFASRLLVETPDPRVDAAAAMAVAGVDGAWYGDRFVHGSMSWNAPYLGWRTTIGGTMLGWHDRVKTSVDTYLPAQVTASEKTSGEARGMHDGRDFLLVQPGPDSRFYGRGYIQKDQSFYEMQTQYFDQVLQDWRWRPSDDPDHEAKLRQGLELHVERLRECYDPDDNGTYESMINTWPTDSIWFSGGGCPDATAYAHRAHEFARDLARRAGDEASATAHQARMDKIKAAFFEELWVAEAGHPGLVREQGGHRRLVNNPWLYSLCIPIEAGLLTPEQAATTLHNAEYNLENIPMQTGGRRVVTSNFTPSIWSVRELWPGDNYMLALAFFRSGLARDGWDVLRGNILHSAFNDLVPGDPVNRVGTDFGDAVHPFTRTLVEGLFGYQPDYPLSKVLVAPQFPADWNRAALTTPAVALRFHREGRTSTLSLRLPRAASLDVELPVRATAITVVTVNGKPSAHRTRPGFGATIVCVNTTAAAGETIEVGVTTADTLPEAHPVDVQGVTGTGVALEFPDTANTTLLSFSDPLGALTNASLKGNSISANLSGNTGHRRVFATVKTGDLEQIRIFNLHILPDPDTPATTLAGVPADASWKPVDLSAHLTADITQIYRQKYLSPRPATVSTRIGTDGYSTWCFPHWGESPPEVAIDKVPGLLDPDDPGRLVTPQGVPFQWGGSTANVAFTSLWDNWPDKITVPVRQSGEAAWFLIGGSTTVMQSRVPNAVLRLRYADGVEETVELVPPFNYWNLSPIRGKDYTGDAETFTVPKPWPMTVDLGSNCRAMVLNRKLRPRIPLESVTLEALSGESVIGIMGVTLMNPES
jgi:hypothetical protein